jgi:hypothetical protein
MHALATRNRRPMSPISIIVALDDNQIDEVLLSAHIRFSLNERQVITTVHLRCNRKPHLRIFYNTRHGDKTHDSNPLFVWTRLRSVFLT